MSPACSSHSCPRLWALLPCAGTGQRALRPDAPAYPKQYQNLARQPLVLHTIAAFAAVPRIHATLLAVAAGDDFLVPYQQAHQQSLNQQGARWHIAHCGGPTRAATVAGGLAALRTLGAVDGDWVLVHDAARCLIEPVQIQALIDACVGDAVGGLLALKLPDTLKQARVGADATTRVERTIERSDKWLAQTPQMFPIGLLERALRSVGDAVTDEASAIEHLGLSPRLVEGTAQNFKVTYPADFALAQAVLAARGLEGQT